MEDIPSAQKKELESFTYSTLNNMFHVYRKSIININKTRLVLLKYFIKLL